jgi:hypothetical protein
VVLTSAVVVWSVLRRDAREGARLALPA